MLGFVLVCKLNSSFVGSHEISQTIESEVFNITYLTYGRLTLMTTKIS